MNQYLVTFNGNPKPQPRPRAFARKMGARYVARVYDSDSADAWKELIKRECWAQKYGANIGMATAALEVRLSFFFARPKSHFKADGTLNARAPEWHCQRPDSDNLAKAVLDAVTDSGVFWKDDAQVVDLRVTKDWSRGQPGCLMEIRRL